MMPGLSPTAVMGKHRMGWLVFCTGNSCLLMSRSEGHASLGGHQEPAWSLAVNFMGQQQGILPSCRGLRGVETTKLSTPTSPWLRAAGTWMCSAGPTSISGDRVCPGFIASLFPKMPIAWLPSCQRLLLYGKGFLCVCDCGLQDNSHWRASNT